MSRPNLNPVSFSSGTNNNNNNNNSNFSPAGRFNNIANNNNNNSNNQYNSPSSSSNVVEIIGGNQSSKRLLDLVWTATESEDLGALEALRKEFIAVPENAVRCVDEAGNTLVHVAAQRSITTLQFVVERLGCKPEIANLHGKTPLHVAVACNNVACIEYLLKKERGTEYAATVSHTLSTAFHTAASCGSVDSMKLLLQAAVEDEGKNELDKVNELDQNKCNALHKCAYDGDIRVAEWLLRKGINANQRDFQGNTPLMVAAKVGRLDVCKLLVQATSAADVNNADAQGNTALHHAASRCYPELVLLLLDSGARLNAVNAEYNTPLHLCAIHGKPEVPGWEDMIVQLASVAGRDVLERQNVFGKTPVECVPRQSQKLFTKPEAERRAQMRKMAEEQATLHEKESLEARSKLLTLKRREIEDRQSKLAEEEERLQREAEDRYRQEEDARLRREEEIEKVRAAEEEVKRKKREKQLAKSGAGKAGNKAAAGSASGRAALAAGVSARSKSSTKK